MGQVGQLWRVEMPTARSGGQQWVVGGLIVYACVIVDSAPIFRRWRGEELWRFRAWVRSQGGSVRLCRGEEIVDVRSVF